MEHHPDDHLHQKRQEEFEDPAGGSQAPNFAYSLHGVVQRSSLVCPMRPKFLALVVEKRMRTGSKVDRNGVFMPLPPKQNKTKQKSPNGRIICKDRSYNHFFVLSSGTYRYS